MHKLKKFSQNLSLILVFVMLAGFADLLYPGSFSVDRIEPPNWWAGMRDTTLQLMIYGRNLGGVQFKSNSSSISVKKVYAAENAGYLFVDINIARNTPAGEYIFMLVNGSEVEQISYPLFDRMDRHNSHQSIGEKDIVYLITPDRFVNGDTANDAIDGMRDTYRPEHILGRHGGDIAGIISKIPYLHDLGVSAIWINPLVENDMPISYHGYAATDLYRIDPRFGNNDLYRKMVSEAHRYDIKVIIDHVSNHIGIYHHWMLSLPMSSWINGTITNHQSTRHRKEVLHDIHHDSLEVINLKEGWFVDEMPDLNQKNPFLARYLIQNTIWWLEFSGADGIREDTYPYADDQFLADWADKIRQEYPELYIVGEVWIQDPVFLAAYMENSYLTVGFSTNLPSVTDFGLFEAFGDVFNRNESISRLYQCISRDFLYPDPDNLLIFADNHDVMRTMDMVGADPVKYRMLFKILMTMRGIPQIYYGSEIGLAGGGLDHGEIRADFPGGFPGDSRNAFIKSGRTTEEDAIFELFKRLISIRRTYPALQTGEFKHLPPEDEIYIYIRQIPGQRIIVVVNNNNDTRQAGLDRVRQYLRGFYGIEDLLTRERFRIDADLELEVSGKDAGIYLLTD